MLGFNNSSIDGQELLCLSTVIYHEARGEPKEGKDAVAHVVLNRLNHKWYADSICGVVYQKHQFTDVETVEIITDKHWVASVKTAVDAITNVSPDPTNGAIMYYNPKKIPKPRWDFSKLTLTGDIYNHRFYKQKGDDNGNNYR